MVLPASRRIPRVLRYSGTGSLLCHFVYGTVTLFGRAFQPCSPMALVTSRRPSTPAFRRMLVWAPPLSLAATQEIVLTFFSSGYLDVSVPRVPSHALWIHPWVTGHDSRWVSPFGHLWIKACLRLPTAFRSLPRPSSAFGALASALCSS